MRVLAIETVEKTGSVALLDDDAVLVERALDEQMRSAQSLAPGIRESLLQAGWRPGDIQLVTVASGPGSFTGLRIGVTTAKVLAYAIGCPVVDVGTMAAIASRAPADVAQLSVVVDAYRGELFVADFERVEGKLIECRPTRIEVAQQWINGLSPDTVVSGPGLANYRAQLGAKIRAVDASLWPPTAMVVGQLGWNAFLAGQRAEPFELVPRYYRRTAAEEKAGAESD